MLLNKIFKLVLLNFIVFHLIYCSNQTKPETSELQNLDTGKILHGTSATKGSEIHDLIIFDSTVQISSAESTGSLLPSNESSTASKPLVDESSTTKDLARGDSKNTKAKDVTEKLQPDESSQNSTSSAEKGSTNSVTTNEPQNPKTDTGTKSTPPTESNIVTTAIKSIQSESSTASSIAEVDISTRDETFQKTTESSVVVTDENISSGLNVSKIDSNHKITEPENEAETTTSAFETEPTIQSEISSTTEPFIEIILQGPKNMSRIVEKPYLPESKLVNYSEILDKNLNINATIIDLESFENFSVIRCAECLVPHDFNQGSNIDTIHNQCDFRWFRGIINPFFIGENFSMEVEKTDINDIDFDSNYFWCSTDIKITIDFPEIDLEADEGDLNLTKTELENVTDTSQSPTLSENMTVASDNEAQKIEDYDDLISVINLSIFRKAAQTSDYMRPVILQYGEIQLPDNGTNVALEKHTSNERVILLPSLESFENYSEFLRDVTYCTRKSCETIPTNGIKLIAGIGVFLKTKLDLITVHNFSIQLKPSNASFEPVDWVYKWPVENVTEFHMDKSSVSPKTLYLQEGSNVIIKCGLKTNSNISWKINENGNFTKPLTENGSLIIENSTFLDTGKYLCYQNNTEKEYKIFMFFQSETPKFVQNPAELMPVFHVENFGQSFHIPCIVNKNVSVLLEICIQNEVETNCYEDLSAKHDLTRGFDLHLDAIQTNDIIATCRVSDNVSNAHSFKFTTGKSEVISIKEKSDESQLLELNCENEWTNDHLSNIEWEFNAKTIDNVKLDGTVLKIFEATSSNTGEYTCSQDQKLIKTFRVYVKPDDGRIFTEKGPIAVYKLSNLTNICKVAKPKIKPELEICDFGELECIKNSSGRKFHPLTGYQINNLSDFLNQSKEKQLFVKCQLNNESLVYYPRVESSNLTHVTGENVTVFCGCFEDSRNVSWIMKENKNTEILNFWGCSSLKITNATFRNTGIYSCINEKDQKDFMIYVYDSKHPFIIESPIFTIPSNDGSNRTVTIPVQVTDPKIIPQLIGYKNQPIAAQFVSRLIGYDNEPITAQGLRVKIKDIDGPQIFVTAENFTVALELFTSSETDIVIPKNHSSKIFCGYHGKISWNHRLLKTTKINSNSSRKIETSKFLEIRNPQYMDTGRYSCLINGTIFRSFNVFVPDNDHVFVADTVNIIIISETTRSNMSSEIILPCRTSIAARNFSLQQCDDSCQNVENFTFNDENDVIIRHNNSISKYVCKDESSGQFISNFITTEPSERIIVSKNETIAFHCGCNLAENTSSIKWKFQSTQVYNNSKTAILDKNNCSSLKIVNSSVENVGRYQCIVANQTAKSYYLFVNDSTKIFVDSTLKTILVPKENLSHELTIPCQTVLPNYEISLQTCEKNIKNCRNVLIPPKFDPKIGARISITEFTRAVKCLGSNNLINETSTFIIHTLPDNFHVSVAIRSNKITSKRLVDENLVLLCEIRVRKPTKAIPYKVSWHHETKEIKPIDVETTAYHRGHSAVLISNATFSMLKFSDSGDYLCSVEFFNSSNSDLSYNSVNKFEIDMSNSSILDVKLRKVIVHDKDLSLAREIDPSEMPRYEIILHKVSDKAANVTLIYDVKSLPGIKESQIQPFKEMYKIPSNCINVTNIDDFNFSVEITAQIPARLAKFNGKVNTTFTNGLMTVKDSFAIRTSIEPNCEPKEPANLLILGEAPCQHKLYPKNELYTFQCTFNSLNLIDVTFKHGNKVFDNESNSVNCARYNKEVYNKITCNLTLLINTQENVSCFGASASSENRKFLNHTFEIKLAEERKGLDLYMSKFGQGQRKHNLTIYDFEGLEIRCNAPRNAFKPDIHIQYITDGGENINVYTGDEIGVQWMMKTEQYSYIAVLTIEKLGRNYQNRTFTCKGQYASDMSCPLDESRKVTLHVKESIPVQVLNPEEEYNQTSCYVIPRESDTEFESNCENITVCSAFGSPEPEVIWYKGDMSSTERAEVSKPEREKKDNSILISTALDNYKYGQKPSSQYTCRASNKIGDAIMKDSFTIFVDVFEKPQIKFPASFFNNPKDKDDIYFEIIAGNPEPETKFIKILNDTHAVSGAKWKKPKERDGKFYLFEHNADFNFKGLGQYRVVATNEAGSEKTTISLQNEDDDNYSKYTVAIISCLGAVTLIAVLAAAIALVKRLKELSIRGQTQFEKNMISLKKMSIAPEQNMTLEVPEVQDIRNWGLILDERQLEIHNRIGQGAFGTVYRGYMTTLMGTNYSRTEVAIKQLKNGIEDTRSLCIEMALLLHVRDHPNVLKLLGITTSKTLKLVLEYAPYGNLRTFLKANRSNFPNYILPPSVDTYRGSYRPLDTGGQNEHRVRAMSMLSTTVGSPGNSTSTTNDKSHLQCRELAMDNLLGYALQMAQGMIYLHSKHMIHRDIAARNILVFSDKLVKIGDFGLARNLYHNTVYHMTSNKIPFRWMALETIRDSNYSYQSDVWSYGILLWEIFSLGTDPYPGFADDRDLFDRLTEGYRMDCPNLLNDTHRDVYNLMLCCWENTPDDRVSFREIKVGRKLLTFFVAPTTRGL